MTDMQQLLVGMNELNEGVQIAEARATDAERQAQATQQELARSQQAGAEGQEKSQFFRNRCKGSARSRRGINFNRTRVRTTSGESRLQCFAVGRDDVLSAHWQKFTNTWMHTGTNWQD